ASARPVLELEDHREVAEPHGEEHLEVAARLTLVRMMAAAEDPGVEGARGADALALPQPRPGRRVSSEVEEGDLRRERDVAAGVLAGRELHDETGEEPVDRAEIGLLPANLGFHV